MDVINKTKSNDTESSKVEVKDDVQKDSLLLVMLDDHCLFEILQHLKFPDIARVANVCIRLNQIAKSVFTSKLKHIEVILGMEDDRNVLDNFGTSMEAVRTFSINMVEAISQRCNSLKTLIIAAAFPTGPFVHGVFLTEDLMTKFQPFFAKLEKLAFRNCLCVDQIKTGLIDCHKLKYFEIESKIVEEDDSELRFYSHDEWKSREEQIPFVNLHSSDLFRTIGANMPNLEALHIDVKYMKDSSDFQRDVVALSNLSSLKALELHFYNQTVSKLLESMSANLIQIEYLNLKCAKIDWAGIESICKIKSIKDIEIYECTFNSEHLVRLAEGLPLLNSIRIEYKYSFNRRLNIDTLRRIVAHANVLNEFSVINCHSDTKFGLNEYESILMIIQNRKEKMGLKLYFKYHEYDFGETFEKETELENGEKFHAIVENTM